jgi:hypothetical protein
MEDLVETRVSLLKNSGGFAEILYLLLPLQVLVLLVLKLLFEGGVCGQRFLELLMQPIHRNGVALLHPLKFRLERSSVCMAKLLAQHRSNKHKGKPSC